MGEIVPAEDDEAEHRATFLHPNGATERTGWGEAHAPSNDIVYVKTSTAPDWIREHGVEVVVADRGGNVQASFTVGTVSVDKDALLLRP